MSFCIKLWYIETPATEENSVVLGTVQARVIIKQSLSVLYFSNGLVVKQLFPGTHKQSYILIH